MYFKGKNAHKKLTKGLRKWLKENTWTEYYRSTIEKSDSDVFEIKIFAKSNKK